jgi:hypothetical protein
MPFQVKRLCAEAMMLPMYMRVLPIERYGQFCSANALVRSVATIAGGFVVGLFMDLMKHFYNGSDYAYRFIPLWSIFWSAIALFFLWRLYQDWKSCLCTIDERGHACLERETHSSGNLIDEQTLPCACTVESTMHSLLRLCEKNPKSAIKQALKQSGKAKETF